MICCIENRKHKAAWRGTKDFFSFNLYLFRDSIFFFCFIGFDRIKQKYLFHFTNRVCVCIFACIENDTVLFNNTFCGVSGREEEARTQMF